MLKTLQTRLERLEAVHFPPGRMHCLFVETSEAREDALARFESTGQAIRPNDQIVFVSWMSAAER